MTAYFTETWSKPKATNHKHGKTINSICAWAYSLCSLLIICYHYHIIRKVSYKSLTLCYDAAPFKTQNKLFTSIKPKSPCTICVLPYLHLPALPVPFVPFHICLCIFTSYCNALVLLLQQIHNAKPKSKRVLNDFSHHIRSKKRENKICLYKRCNCVRHPLCVTKASFEWLGPFYLPCSSPLMLTTRRTAMLKSRTALTWIATRVKSNKTIK